LSQLTVSLIIIIIIYNYHSFIYYFLLAEFTVPQGFTSATIVISGVGYYELFLNGNKVGDHKLDPGWTHYAKRYLLHISTSSTLECRTIP
jgi:hypothetical protein